MEDALAHYPGQTFHTTGLGLNPCCNGRCTRTYGNARVCDDAWVVLILVVMEDALAHG